MKPIQMTLVEPCQVKIGDIYLLRLPSTNTDDYYYLIPAEVTELIYTLRKCEPSDICAYGFWTATIKSIAENEDIFKEESVPLRYVMVYSDIDGEGFIKDPRVLPKDACGDFLKIFTEQNCVTRKYKAIRANNQLFDV